MIRQYLPYKSGLLSDLTDIMTGKYFKPDELNWIGIKFLDPIGRVFLMDGDYYRAIYPEKVEYVHNLFKSGLIDELIREKILLPVQQTDIVVEGYGLVLKTKGTTWKIEPHTFTRRTLKMAALNWIKMNEFLLIHDMGLIDAHLGNVRLTGKCEPLWIDLGSIQPLNREDQGIREFMQCQIHPLVIFGSQKNLDHVVRLLIQNGGISNKEFNNLIGLDIVRFISVKMINITAQINRILRHFGLESVFQRRFYLKLLKNIVASVNVEPPHKSWTDYRNSDVSQPETAEFNQTNADSRPQKVLDLINKIHPKTMIDVGANDGVFSVLAAQSCNKLLAIDSDEGAIDKFVQWALNTPLDIEASGCVDDFHHIHYRADLVLGLALVHHLAISQQYKFDYIAKRFADMSDRALITEFMPNGIGVGKKMPDPLPEYYKLEYFIIELKKYFTCVDVINYDRDSKLSPRILIFCYGKIDSDN